MPVTHTDFAFTEESFDPTEYPDEIRPTESSDRFPFVAPKAKVDQATLSKTAAAGPRPHRRDGRGLARTRSPRGCSGPSRPPTAGPTRT